MKALLAFLAASALLAQDYRGKVQGIVTDATQALVPGASATLRNTQTGVQVVRQADGNGRYFFDFVEPGSYTLTVEAAGFGNFTRENILVQVRSDLTVNAVLNVGAVTESVTVSEAVAPIQFNTTNMELTVDRKMLNDLPVIARNPFTLALLDPAVVNRYTTDRNPFFMWSSSRIDVGGSTSGKNDLLLDGAPLQLGQKGSYAPPMDAVQEFTVQQNSVDAEFGHSAGGILSLSMKAGTNEYHGTAYYFGRNPALNAVSNAITRGRNQVKNHIWGGTLGNPILKNKLFTFNTWEQWRTRDPKNATRTLPTALEREGDFSKSLNQFGGLRAVYDPMTTAFNAANNTAPRQPFAGNIIPRDRMDATSLRFLKDIWAPNGVGDDITGVNNFRTAYAWKLSYWNFSNRTDWNINSKWKVFGRYSRFKTYIDQDNWADSAATPNDNGGIMFSRQIAGDAVYTVNATTVINLRANFTSLADDYDAPAASVGEKGLEQFWPGNAWYKPYLKDMPAVYYPNLDIGGGFGKYGYWTQHPRNYSGNASLRKTAGRSQWKFGGEGRWHRSWGIHPQLMTFPFGAGLTTSTAINADTRRDGHAWATFLLGYVGSDTVAQHIAKQEVGTNYYGAYAHNDFKLNRRVTLNLGLRYEYAGAPYDAQNRFSRYLDLDNPIPEMQAAPPRIPNDVRALMDRPYVFNGAWVFTDDENRGWYNNQNLILLPRVGAAVRLNDKTALRFGFARYVTPPLTQTNTIDRLTFDGFNARTTAAPVLQGRPQTRLSNPFPASNPLILPVGKAFGRYTNLGGAPGWQFQNFKGARNDRFNVSIQRQLPMNWTLDVTAFFNFGDDLPYSFAVNQTNPRLSYQYQARLSETVANPFFQYMTPETFPGQLRNQATVTRGSLLRPYPHYTGLSQNSTPGVRNRYNSLQMKAQRQFSKGYSVLATYNFNRERTEDFFNTDDQFDRKFSFIDSDNARHRMTVAGTWDLPVGKGRRLLGNAHWLANAIAGGWSTSTIYTWGSGTFLRFGQMEVKGDPLISDPTVHRWFNTAAFDRPLPFTPRLNPWQYEGLTGPGRWNFDTTLSKFFPITERTRVEFKMEAYNLTNSFMPGNPNLTVTSSLFGRSTTQANRGREVQYTMRLIW